MADIARLDTLPMRWESLLAAVRAAQRDPSPENVAGVHRARDAYVEMWERQRARKTG